MTSPFTTHRNTVLGHYSTAKWLRHVVVSMWSGEPYVVSLSPVARIDAEHFTAFREMLEAFRANGENDPAFESLAHECFARMKHDKATEERT